MAALPDLKRHLVIGADHAGYELKDALVGFVKERGFSVHDVGTHGPEPVDYPDYAKALALHMILNPGSRGILICGSGVGASIAANKFKGIRAAICHDPYSAHQGVEHDDMNVLVLGSRVVALNLAEELVARFLDARFSGEARHVRRLEKIKSFEEQEETCR